MWGDVPMAEVVEYLERNPLGLKLTDKNVVVGHIRPLRTFNLTCMAEHRMGNHLLNQKLVRTCSVRKLSQDWDYDSWYISEEGKNPGAAP